MIRWLLSLLLIGCVSAPGEQDDCYIVKFDVRLGTGADECRIVFDDDGIDTCGVYAGRRCVVLQQGESLDVADAQNVISFFSSLNEDGSCPLECLSQGVAWE